MPQEVPGTPPDILTHSSNNRRNSLHLRQIPVFFPTRITQRISPCDILRIKYVLQEMLRPIHLIALLATLSFVACKERTAEVESAKRDTITIKDAYGLSPDRIEELWNESLVPIEGSFANLVSKNLHPYTPPRENKLLRYGDAYLILEFSNDRLIAIHSVHG